MMPPEVIEVEALQAIAEMYRKRCEHLLDKIHSYYYEELTLRGDKNLNKEFKEYFGIE